MVSEEIVWEKLEQVKDPEFGQPATDMNLIDEVQIEGTTVSVVYHLTAPMCPPPFALSIGKQIRKYVSELEGAEKVKVRVQKHNQAELLNKHLKKHEND